MFHSRPDHVSEEQCVFESRADALYGVLYAPSRVSPFGAAVICPPEGEERGWSHRHLVRSARALAEAGLVVLRFDFMGQGESDGDYEDSTIETRVADLRASLDVLKQTVPFASAVIGVRFGAAVALRLASSESSIDRIVLWEPVFNPAAYLHQLLRTNLSTQMVAHGSVTSTRADLVERMRAGGTANVNGFNLTGRLLDEASSLEPMDALTGFRGTALVLTSRAGVESSDRRTVVPVQGPPFWKEPKIYTASVLPYVEPTVRWLKDYAS